jgi:hypothetical protein
MRETVRRPPVTVLEHLLPQADAFAVFISVSIHLR